jgi:hypothetical protein
MPTVGVDADEFTVSVAFDELVLMAPLQLVTLHRYCRFPRTEIPATFKVADVVFVYKAPVGIPFITFSHVPPLLYSH